MLTTEKYTIIDEPEHMQKINTTLCILNFDILKHKEYVKKLIDKNKTTTFWVTSNDFSKNYIKAVSKMGVQNVIQFPIQMSAIENFFNVNNNDKSITDYKPLISTKILIVDDNEMNIELLKETLIDIGSDIRTCTNPTIAKEIVKENQYDLILLDILMPEISGFELAEIIRTTELNKSTQIIFISAITESTNKINGYKLGACSYIEKPFSPAIVKAQIYNFLKNIEKTKYEKKEKDNFIATLTHDLKSPINAEISALNYLIKTPNNNTLNDEMLTELLNSAKYMKQITDKILSHYKQQSGKLNLRKEYINSYKLVLSCIEELKFLALEKNINIRFYNNTTTKDIYADYLEIKRVINNLISNAIEYSFQNNNIDIKISNSQKNFIFEVQDYGIGINLEKYSKIFDEYITLSKEQKKVGFGLGLNICKNIIEAHGGKIEILSEENKGTLIKFYLPDKCEELD